MTRVEPMTLEELITAAADLERALTERVHVWRAILEQDGHGGWRECQRIYRGSFYRPRTNDTEDR